MLLRQNPLRNQLDTTPDPLVFPTRTNVFQKPIKFKSDMGNEFYREKGEKLSKEKPKEKLNEHPQPKPNHRQIQFHCEYCGRDGHKDEFCFKSNQEERMAKEWAKEQVPPISLCVSQVSGTWGLHPGDRVNLIWVCFYAAVTDEESELVSRRNVENTFFRVEFPVVNHKIGEGLRQNVDKVIRLSNLDYYVVYVGLVIFPNCASTHFSIAC
jgi:hypothetical protein